MSDYTTWLSTVVNVYPTNAPDPFFAQVLGTMNMLGRYNTKVYQIFEAELNDNSTTTIPLTTAGGTSVWKFILMRVIGKAQIETSGVDTDGTTSITGFTVASGVELYPGFAIVDSYNITSTVSIRGKEDGTIIEVFAAFFEEDS